MLIYIGIILFIIALVTGAEVIGSCLKKAKAEKATMTDTIKSQQSTLDKLNKELKEAHEENTKLRKMYEDETDANQQMADEIQQLKQTGQAEKAAERTKAAIARAAEAEEAAAIAQQKAEAAAKLLTETTERVASAKSELKAIQYEARKADKKLCSLSELYQAVTMNNTEDSNALDIKSRAIEHEIASIEDAIRLAKRSEYYFSATNQALIAAILAYDEHGKLIAGAPVATDADARLRPIGTYLLWCESGDTANRHLKELKKQLARSTKILCFAKSAHVIIKEGKIVFHSYKGDVEIEIGEAKATRLDPDEGKMLELIGEDAREKQAAQIEALQERQKAIQRQIFEISQRELVNPVVDILVNN